MTHPTTPPLDEVKGLLEKATPGPWVASYHAIMASGSTDTADCAVWAPIASADELEIEDGEGRIWTTNGSRDANARLISLAPTIAAAWVEAVGERDRISEVLLQQGEIVRVLREQRDEATNGMIENNRERAAAEARVAALQSTITRLEGELAAALNNLNEYGRHLPECDAALSTEDCTCGLDRALTTPRHPAG